MAYQVNLTRRALRDLAYLYRRIEAEVSPQALRWFTGLETAIYSLEQHPDRAPTTPEDATLRHLLYGRKPHVYRIIYEIEKRPLRVNVLHIRHGARDKMPKRSRGSG
jgi:plasmid stabilization system protein ParE